MRYYGWEECSLTGEECYEFRYEELCGSNACLVGFRSAMFRLVLRESGRRFVLINGLWEPLRFIPVRYRSEL